MAEDASSRDAQFAAELERDAAVEHLATVYAQALLAAAENAGQTAAVLAELDDLVAQVLDAFPQFEAVLGSALITHEERLGILGRVFGGRLSPLMLNFLKVVSRHGRLDCLRAIHARLHGLYDELRGRVPVKLTTAAPIDDVLAGRIADGLRALVGGEPRLTRAVDPELIAGAVVQVGDTVYDGSVATQLQTIRQQMIDRSVHEIQSRRDRFRYPAGN